MTTLATRDYAVAETAVAKVQQSVATLIRACPAVITTPEDREAGSVARRAIREREAEIEKERKALVGPLNDTVKRINDLFRGPLEALRTADDHQKALALAYDAERERIRLDEQRRLQAIADETARKERQKIEQEAERQRQIQREKEAIAAEARRKAEEAEGAERKRLLAEAEAADRKAAAAAAKVEVKEEQTAAIVAPVVTLAEPEKPKGESTRKLWRARLTDKMALIQAAAQGNEIAATCLAFDQTAANKLATATKGAVLCPGIEWYAETSLAMRGE
jgi:hypothetical protein